MIKILYNYKKVACGLIGSILALYIVQSTSLWRELTQVMDTTAIVWGYWIAVIILMQWYLPKVHSPYKMSKQSDVAAWAFNIAASYIVINMLAGVMFGFGKSPYNHSLRGITLNLLTLAIPLVARECIRAYAVNVFCRREQMKAFVAIVLIMTLTQITPGRWVNVSSLEQFTILAAEQVLPKLCENLLATYLVMYGGVKCSLIYLGMVAGFEWCSPILPNIDWLIKGIIGMLVPIGGTSFVIKSYMVISHQKKDREEESENMWTFIPVALCSVMLIWFTAGLFPIYPSAIATGSMQPMINPGDVILAEKITDKQQLEVLQEGEIIQFRRDDILITHRIIEVIERDGLKEYRTKGDNNSSEDSRLVQMEEVKGIYKGCIPKIGWPTLIFKNNNRDIVDEVEF